MSKHRGFWFEVVLSNGASHHVSAASLSEMDYLIRRNYSRTPGMEKIVTHVGERTIATIMKGSLEMTNLFATYRAENPVKSGFLPGIDQKEDKERGFRAGPGKEFLVKTKLAFTVTKASESDHGEYAYIDYDIKFVDDIRFQQVQAFQEIEREYTLSLPSTPDRVRQLNEVFRNHIVEKDVPIRLIKEGKRFDFDMVE